MNHVADKNEGNERPRRGGIDMTKTSRVELDNLDRFMAAMARVLGIRRKTLEKFMLLEQTPLRQSRLIVQRRRANRPSPAVK